MSVCVWKHSRVCERAVCVCVWESIYVYMRVCICVCVCVYVSLWNAFAAEKSGATVGSVPARLSSHQRPRIIALPKPQVAHLHTCLALKVVKFVSLLPSRSMSWKIVFMEAYLRLDSANQFLYLNLQVFWSRNRTARNLLKELIGQVCNFVQRCSLFTIANIRTHLTIHQYGIFTQLE